MRTKIFATAGALLLASTFAGAQQAPQAPKPAGQATDVVAQPSLGNIDIGFRASDFGGDAARGQRYVDTRDKGAGVNFKFNREGQSWFFDAGGRNIGYYDQEFRAAFGGSKVKASFEWNQTPLYYGAEDFLKTPYKTSVSNGVATMSLDQALRQTVQDGFLNANGTAKSVPTAVPYPVSAATIGLTPVYRNAMVGTEIRSRRDNVNFGLTYEATKELEVELKVNSYKKNGSQPWGASFAFNDAVELALPLDNRTTNVEVGTQWANRRGMVRVGFERSMFNNNIDTLVWNNPMRAVDTQNAQAYSNGALGAAWGRMALWPDSTENRVSATGLIKLPARSSINASMAYGKLSQDAALLPMTINTTFASLGLDNTSALYRKTTQGEAAVTSMNVNFQTRPTRTFGLTAKYRYYHHDNRTPVFDNSTNVRFDGALEAFGPTGSGASESEPVSVKRQSFNVDATFTPITYVAFRVGAGNEQGEHTYRMFPDTSETSYRASVDTVGNQYVMLRALVERSDRKGSNFEPEVLSAASQQPNMRQYDVANRKRDRASLVLELTPVDVMAVNVSYFVGNDKYNEAAQEFGLLKNDNNGYNVGLGLTPAKGVSFDVNYGRENYDGRQGSRYARPVAPTEQSFFDPTNNWFVDTSEKVDNYGLSLGLDKLIPKTEIRFGYDYSKSNQGFDINGPRVQKQIAGTAASGANGFEPMPDVTNKMRQGTADVKYFLTPKFAIGGTYYYTKFDVNDWATVSFSDNLPRFDYLGSLTTGYAIRSFKANTGMLRILYFF